MTDHTAPETGDIALTMDSTMTVEERIAKYADATVAASQSEEGLLILTLAGAGWLADNATDDIWQTAIDEAQVRAGVDPDVPAQVATLISIGAGFFLIQDSEGEMQTTYQPEVYARMLGLAGGSAAA